MEKIHLPKSLLESSAWNQNANPIWPASSFFLIRNFSKMNFSSKLSQSLSAQLLERLSPLFAKIPALQHPTCIKAEQLDAQEKEFLFEHFLCKEGFQNTTKGQAFVVDDSSHFLGLMNIYDHLQLQWIDSKGQWEKAWETLNNIALAVSSSMDFAFSPRFGYLTSDPSHCGTGLIVTCYLHIPALLFSGKLQEALSQYKEGSVLATGLQGKADELIGDFLVLQNNYTLGINEEAILRDLHTSATKIVLAEKTIRAHFKEKNDSNLRDLIGRGFGLLKHSYQLQTKEALDALSKIKLGIDLGWVGGISDTLVNEIFFQCRRAHLGFISQAAFSDHHNIARKRAEFIHKEIHAAEFAS